MRDCKEYVAFMTEYADFAEDMADEGQEKLRILMKNELKELEESVMVQQATAKRLEELEKRRLALQQEAGFGDAAFREIVDMADGEDKEALAGLFERIGNAVEWVKFYNGKAMEIVKTNLKIFDGQMEAKGNGIRGYSANMEVEREKPDRKSAAFEKKI